MAKRRPENTLNELDSKSWVKTTKSWFVVNPRSRTDDELRHPAKFPEELVSRLVRFFTKREDWVLDPFAGVGSTLLSCQSLGRRSVGIELSQEFAAAAARALSNQTSSVEAHMITGDARESSMLLQQRFGHRIPVFRYLITSPPYFDMLSKSRGGNESAHKERAEKGLTQVYSDSESDIGNIESYDAYLRAVVDIMANLKTHLSEGAYLTVVAQNMRDVDGVLRPIAWDLARGLSQHFALRQEMIWCQDNKRLGCWGYPTTYVSNVHHHYCIHLQNTI